MDAWIRIGAGADASCLWPAVRQLRPIAGATTNNWITRYGQATALTPATTKARVSCDHTGGRAAQPSAPLIDDERIAHLEPPQAWDSRLIASDALQRQGP